MFLSWGSKSYQPRRSILPSPIRSPIRICWISFIFRPSNRIGALVWRCDSAVVSQRSCIANIINLWKLHGTLSPLPPSEGHRLLFHSALPSDQDASVAASRLPTRRGLPRFVWLWPQLRTKVLAEAAGLVLGDRRAPRARDNEGVQEIGRELGLSNVRGPLRRKISR